MQAPVIESTTVSVIESTTVPVTTSTLTTTKGIKI